MAEPWDTWGPPEYISASEELARWLEKYAKTLPSAEWNTNMQLHAAAALLRLGDVRRSETPNRGA